MKHATSGEATIAVTARPHALTSAGKDALVASPMVVKAQEEFRANAASGWTPNDDETLLKRMDEVRRLRCVV